MAPMMQNGSAPEATAGGRAASAGAPVADGATEDGVAGLEGVEHGGGRDRVGHVEVHLAGHGGQGLEVGREHDPDHDSVCTSTDRTAGRSVTIGRQRSPASGDT